jgi:LDH2 family malate/lactate/ureidoglycolate dehydrogenase
MLDRVQVSVGGMTNFCSNVLVKLGVPEDDSQLAAKVLVAADERGVYSHGAEAIARRYVRELRNGVINAQPEIRVLKEGSAYALLDADRALGQVVSVRAMQMAIDKAQRTTIACSGVINSNHYGAAAYYVMMASDRDMIGFSTSTSPGCNLAAFNGVTPVVGNIPLAYAVPGGEEHAVVLDMATGAVGRAKIHVFGLLGQEIPLGWALSKEGEPTTDPDEAAIILPAGGAKGYGLAVVMDALAGVMLGEMASCRKGARTVDQQSGWTHFFMAVNIGDFRPVEDFKREIDEMSKIVRATRPIPGVDRVYLPGEIEWLKHKQAQASGIPYWSEILARLEQVGDELGVVPPWKGQS